MENSKKWFGLGIIILVLVGGGLVFAASQNSKPSPTTTPQVAAGETTSPDASASPQSSPKTVTSAQLKAANGKDGNPCWMSVNKKVYDLPESSVWRDGEHVPSNGLATCGNVGDEIIKRSPHGTEVLSSLTVVGTLAE